jgi:S1-C subfamily serine protease
MGLQNSLTSGIISNSARTVDGASYIQFSAPISSGSSGGVLLDDQGKVIGIIRATILNSQNLNLAIPVDEIKNINTSYSGQNIKATSRQSNIIYGHQKIM